MPNPFLQPEEPEDAEGLENQLEGKLDSELVGMTAHSDLQNTMAAKLAGTLGLGQFAVPIKSNALGAKAVLTPVEHDPWAEATPVLHVGNPTDVGTIATGKTSKDEYKTPDGGSIDFHYDQNGLPLLAEKWSKDFSQSQELTPDKVFFPPKAKPTLHQGDADYIGKLFDTYSTGDGGSIDYHYDQAGAPLTAIKWNAGGTTTEDFTPDQLNFPPKGVPGNDYFGDNDTWGDQTETNDELEAALNEGHQAGKPIPAQWQAAYDALEPHERDAIKEYTGSSFWDINKTVLGQIEGQPSIEEHIANLDSALSKATLPEDMELWRGVRSSVWNQVQDLQPGDIWEHVPYASTSTSQSAASGFTIGPKLKIAAAKGTPGLYLAPISQHPDEHEVLLPRGMKFKVKAIDQGNKLIELEPYQP